MLGYRTPTHSARETTLAAVDSQCSGDDSSTFETLLETLGPGHDVSGILHGPRVDTTAEPGTFEGQIAKGHRYEFQGGECRSRYAFVFESTDDADRDTVSAWVDGGTNGNRLFEAYEKTTIRQNGHIIVVDGTVATQDV